MFDNIELGNFIGFKAKDDLPENINYILNQGYCPVYVTKHTTGNLGKEMEKALGEGLVLIVLAADFKEKILA